MFKASVNQRHSFEIDKDSINGEATTFDCELLPNGKYHILLNNQSLVAEVVNIDHNTKSVSLLVDQRKFDIQIKDDFDLLLSKLGMDKKNTDKVSEIKSPMPGLVLEIKVAVGDEVEAGQPIMVLEAMKMENVISAPNDGKVSKVEVQIQDKVDKNQVLIRFE
ncbi:MAG: biotin carboxyl carrier protein [Bacteroidia bacterium]|jgi:biotin carboxyl carrier protein